MLAPMRPKPIIPSCIVTSRSPPEGAPQAPVHGGVLVHLRCHHLLLRELLPDGERLIALIGLLVADVEALAARRICVDVEQLAVLQVRNHLEWPQGLEMRETLRGVSRLHPEARGRQGRLRLLGLLADRKSTRLNSSHLGISYAVFCLKQ